MEPMSLDELSAVEGGTWIAKLTPNQVIMTLAGFTAAMIAGPISQLSIRVGKVDIASAVDQMVCQSGIGLVGTTLSQGQISAGRIDERQLGVADVGLTLAYSTAMTFAQRGCSKAVEAISQQISRS